jgi:opacity protein-like surface antigen
MRCRVWVLILGLAFSSLGCVAAQEAQASCEETLRQAEDEFRAGRFFGVPSILSECMPRFSREQRFRASLLLTQTHLLLDDQSAAEKSFLEVLRADPEFVPSVQTDAIDIVNLSKKFTSTAVFTPHAKMGLNLARQRVVRYTDLFGMPVVSDEAFRPGWNIGAGVEWNLTPRWGLGAELFFAHRAYRQTRSGFFQQDATTMTARQWWVDVPVYLRYQDVTGKWRPFGYAGYAFNLLLSAQSFLRETDFTSAGGGGDGAAPFQVAYQGPGINVTDRHHRLNRSLLIGGGVKYKIGRDFLVAEARYMAGVNIFSREDRLFSRNGNGYPFDPDIPGFAFVNDLFRLDNLMLNVGYVRPLYKPRKLRKASRFFKRQRDEKE